MKYSRLGDMDLKDKLNNRVFVQFMALDVSVRLQRDGVTKFISFDMVDKDCVIDAKIFRATQEQEELMQNGCVYNAAIDVKPYDKSPTGYSCIVYNIEKTSTSSRDFIKWADGIEESRKVIENTIVEIADTIYGKIAYNIIIDNWEKFCVWTAAKSNHHNTMGGLLVHTAEVITLADRMTDFFNGIYGDDFIDKPLVLASAMLHDVGKVNELDVDTSTGSVEYSAYSSLDTHIMNIITDIEMTAYKLGFGVRDEDELIDGNECTSSSVAEEIEAIKLLKHCVAAHHGRLDWGSPVKPSIPEAYILHISDITGAEMYKYNNTFKDMGAGECISEWNGGGLRNTFKSSGK